jgi:hypothetical protein
MRGGTWTRLRQATLVAILLVGGITTEAEAAPGFGSGETRSTVKLERGRVLTFQLKAQIDSESAKVGDHFTLQLVQSVNNSAGDELLPAGWLVSAHVTSVRRAGKTNCKPGSVSWEPDAAKAPDGTRVKLKILSWRPTGPDGLLAEKVEVKTAEQQFEDVLGDAALVPLFIIALPVEIPMAIAMTGDGERCQGKPGPPWQVGAVHYAAVAKEVRVHPTTTPASAPTPNAQNPS